MNDFLKIFIVLCGLAGAFVFGRNYGESTVLDSRGQKQLEKAAEENEKAQAELFAIKEKFQTLLDSTDLRKADEVLGKIMTIFLADLSLHLSDEKTKEVAELRQIVNACMSPQPQTTKKGVEALAPTTSPPIEKPVTAKTEESSKKWTNEDFKKYKSYEWMLLNSQSRSEISRTLKKLELKDLDSYLRGAPATNLEQAAKFYGAYRGRIIDVTSKEYGTLVIEVQPTKNKRNEDMLKGKIELYRQGKQESNSSFTTPTLGFTPAENNGTVISVGARQVQVYKIESTQQLAGFFYERLPNGTTNTIGTFILNRVDQF